MILLLPIMLSSLQSCSSVCVQCSMARLLLGVHQHATGSTLLPCPPGKEYMLPGLLWVFFFCMHGVVGMCMWPDYSCWNAVALLCAL